MIPRQPASEFKTSITIDQDIINAFEWFKTFIGDKEWNKRKEEIEKYITNKSSSTLDLSKGTLLSIEKDRISWYLYLCHTLIHEPYKYEYFQGANIMPIFKRIGMNLDLVKQIGGINKKIKDLLWKRRIEADAILFEVLTALLWRRNGWEVNILEEGKGSKSPDFSAQKGNDVWQIECKKQKKRGDYAFNENDKRQKMVSHIIDLVVPNNLLLNIVFHVELETLPDTYLRDKLQYLIPKAKIPGKLISNDEVDIDVSFVDIQSIKNYLRNYDLKYPSPKFCELVAQKPVDHLTFTCGCFGNFFRVGDGDANNVYISDIENAFGIHCYCDSEISINKKARDIKKQIFDAIKQFDNSSDGVIHIGIETMDGPEVELERVKKIMNTVENISTANNNLRWIYIHFFQSYTRSYQYWTFDETVHIAGAYDKSMSPLKNIFLIMPEDLDTLENRSHWERPLP